MADEVGRHDIASAAARISGHIRRTPVFDVGNLFSSEYRLALKLEHLQVTGSFKPRGAVSVLSSRDLPEVGVVAASGGNFGIAVAYAAQRLNLRATVFVPATSPDEKIRRITDYGAEVNVVDGYYDEALAASREFAVGTGAFEAHAYDQPEVVAGQGTLARELSEQVEFDSILVAVGGGGLIGGVASWVRDDAHVVAAEPEKCRSFNAALAAGRPVAVDVGGVAASSLGARSIGDHAWAARRWIDESVLVDDRAIIRAQQVLWSETRLMVEPAAAATVAALITGAYEPHPGERVVAVLSGGNVDPGSVR